MSEKTPNYTEAMVERLHEVYQPEASEAEREAQIAALSVELKRNTRSVRAKLTREKLYVPKAYKSKTGAKAETKETIVSTIAAVMEVDADTALSGLEKATKKCLLNLRKALS